MLREAFAEIKERPHRPHPQEFALEPLILAEAIEVVTEVELVARSVSSRDLAYRIAAGLRGRQQIDRCRIGRDKVRNQKGIVALRQLLRPAAESEPQHMFLGGQSTTSALGL